MCDCNLVFDLEHATSLELRKRDRAIEELRLHVYGLESELEDLRKKVEDLEDE